MKKPLATKPKAGRCPACSSIVHSTGAGGVACKACGWKGRYS